MNTLLARLTFVPASHYAGSFTIATTVNDGIAAPVSGIKKVTGTASPEAPSDPVPTSGTTGDSDLINPEQDTSDKEAQEEEATAESPETPREDQFSLDLRNTTAGMRLRYISAKDRGESQDSSHAQSNTSNADKNIDSREPIRFNNQWVNHNIPGTLSDFLNYVREEVSYVVSDFSTSIKMLHKTVELIEEEEMIIKKTIMGGTLTLSAGLATWILRGGSLVASALTTMPIWKGFDPLNVLPLSRKERRKKLKEVHDAEEDERRKDRRVANILDRSARKGRKDTVEEDPS